MPPVSSGYFEGTPVTAALASALSFMGTLRRVAALISCSCPGCSCPSQARKQPANQHEVVNAENGERL